MTSKNTQLANAAMLRTPFTVNEYKSSQSLRDCSASKKTAARPGEPLDSISERTLPTIGSARAARTEHAVAYRENDECPW